MDNIREHLWKYFELHSGQRMSLINFYLVFITALGAGIAATYQSRAYLLINIFLSMFIIVITFIFFKLDQRTTFLIKHAEIALKKFENENHYNEFSLFSNEALSYSTNNAKWLNKNMSYTKLFNSIYIIITLLTIVNILVTFIKIKVIHAS